MRDHRTISIADQIFEQLEREILSGKYKRGDILSEQRLAEELGVSRTPVREAIRRLEQEHILDDSGKGLTVVGISKADMEQMAQGRVWSGLAAKELGLVDELGGLDKAIEIAAAKAGIESYTQMNYPGKNSFWESLINADPGNYIRMQLLDGEMKELYKQANMWKQLEKQDFIQARMPFDLKIQ